MFDQNNPITIVLADDHEVVRVGLRRLISVDKSLKILDEAANGREAIKLAEHYNPHLVLLDILMPEMNGIDAVKHIKNNMKGVMAVMLTAFEDSKHLEQAMQAGADGYLSKDISAKDLNKAIHDVMKGERVFSKSIINIINKKFDYKQLEEEPVIITKREQEILDLVARGRTSQEIADNLDISIRTVESHRYNIMKKLDIKNAAGLVRYAVSGII
ncbi:MAG: response regulator [Candidatus Kapaibacterium sp.]